MPLPKGINKPEVRAAWIVERSARLSDFDRLVSGGLSRNKAAGRVGLSNAGVVAMRHGLEQLASGRRHGRNTADHIDLGLALLTCLRRPGEYLTCEDIAAWCDCSRATIQKIESRALKKVRRRMVEALRCAELGEEVEELLARLLRPESV